MFARKRKMLFQKNFGKEPSRRYFVGDLELIKSYFEFCREQNPDSYYVDDITWNDLDLDRIFKRINMKLTTSGEQTLYYQLRTPVLNPEEYQKRYELLNLVESDPDLRLKLQMTLSRLGCNRHVDIFTHLKQKQKTHKWLLIHILQSLLFAASLVSLVLIGINGILAILGVMVVNGIVHELRVRKCSAEFDWVNYAVSLICTVKKIRKLHDPSLDTYFKDTYKHLERLNFAGWTGGVTKSYDKGLADMLNTVSLLDLIVFEYLKGKLSVCQTEVLSMHEAIGNLDAAISIASYRASLSHFTEPEIDFQTKKPYSYIENMCHPLLEDPVPNSLHTEKPILITGSNASGKSTYLKTAALNTLLAQTICTVPADSYQASAFRIYSSMALNDDLLSGESYYIVEIKSIKRILDKTEGLVPIFCTIDEVLRGTNTVERIAASSEILKHLAGQGVLCLAATHDGELCDLLSSQYEMYHFEEKFENQDMIFDYQIRPGKAVSRNAINLLQLLGFEADIIQGALERANRYINTGIWS